MNNAPTLDVTSWQGIRNKIDAKILGLHGFTVADNVRIDGTGTKLSARQGLVQRDDGNYRGGYATLDTGRAYAINAAGDLLTWPGLDVLRSDFVGEPYWIEDEGILLVGNQFQTWRIWPDGGVTDNALERPAAPAISAIAGSLPAGVYRVVVCNVGREESAPSDEAAIELDGTQNLLIPLLTNQRAYVCPANSTNFYENPGATLLTSRPEYLGALLKTKGLYPMPDGDCLACYQGSLFSSVYLPREDVSVIWRSKGPWWGLSDLEHEIRIRPGEVRCLIGHASGLLIGTDRELGAMIGNEYRKLADFGVARGRAGVIDDGGTIWCLTQRGFVQAFPFLPIAADFAPPLCDFVSTAILREGGDQRLIALASPVGNPDNSST